MLHKPTIFLLLSFLSCLLCSFAEAPPQKRQTPLSTQQRFQHKKQRLQQRLTKATTFQQKKRLKKRLKKLERRVTSPPNSSFEAIFCFVTGTTSIVLLIVSALANSIIGGPLLFGVAFGLSTLLGLAALILGVVYYNKRFRALEEPPQPALAIIGITLGSISFLVGILLLLTFIINLF